MGIFDAIGIDAGIVLIIVILIQLVLIFFLIKQSMKLARLTNKYKMFMRGKDAISLEKAFEKKFEEVDAMTEEQQRANAKKILDSMPRWK